MFILGKEHLVSPCFPDLAANLPQHTRAPELSCPPAFTAAPWGAPAAPGRAEGGSESTGAPAASSQPCCAIKTAQVEVSALQAFIFSDNF